jgi:hypothetical protein
VAQDEELDVFGRRCAAEQGQPAEEPVEDQIQEAKRHVAIMPGGWTRPITAGPELRPASRRTRARWAECSTAWSARDSPREELTRYTTPETGGYSFVPAVSVLRTFASPGDDSSRGAVRR